MGPRTANPLMLKFPLDLIVHKGSVLSLLYVVGGLMMTVTAGSQCVDVNPANLLRLSNTLIQLLGLRYQTHANSVAKRRLKRLYFSDSFNSLLHITGPTLRGTCDLKALCWFPVCPERQTNPESPSTNRMAARRCRIYYILICGASSWPILTLRIGNKSSKLNAYNPSHRLQWLISFGSEAQARGDVIFLLMGGQTGQISTGSDTNEPTSLTLGLSALSVALLWMFLPYIAVCAAICLGWKVRQNICRVAQAQKCS